ncbi:MAG: hypothetical protein Kow0069_24810 [Promethearchaeota archaeon]
MRVVVAGDSITHGLVSHDFVEDLRRQLGRNHLVINAGLNNDMVHDLLVRLDQIVACHPHVVVVMIGTNDANATANRVPLARYVRKHRLPRVPSLAWFEEVLGEVARRLSEAGARVALLSPPVIGEDLNAPEFRRVGDYAAAVKRVAESTGVDYLPLWERMVGYLEAHPSSPRQPFRRQRWLTAKATVRHYLFGTSWEGLARDNGFQLVHDYLHLTPLGAQFVLDLLEVFVRGCLKDAAT